MTDPSPMNRRDFLSKSAAVLATGAVLPHTALSYENIVGANDRISIGHIGIGNRGEELDLIASKLKSIARRPQPPMPATTAAPRAPCSTLRNCSP
jgi:hypothetical protein